MSTSAALVSVEEYLRCTDKPYREYRDGVMTPKSMPTKLHAIIQKLLIRILDSQGVEAYGELTVRVSPTRFLIPDVAVAADFPGRYQTDPIHLCCEILSPDDRLGAMLSKCEEYHAWGVPFCWVIDPEKGTAWEYHAGGEPVRAGEWLRAGSLNVNLNELFAALER